jgi:hypothetical protein
MAFEGNLETMPVADLLQWAANGRMTGTVRVSRGELSKMIYIRDGQVVSCTSTDPREFLGHFLVSHGAIDEAELQDAIARQERDGGLLGEILIDRSAIDREGLERMLRLKAEEAIFDLFTWDHGHFFFADGDLPGYELIPVTLGVAGLVLEGTRRLDEWRRIRDVIPSPLCVPVSVEPLVGAGDDIPVGRRTVLEAVDDSRSVEDICLHTHSSEFYVCEILLQEVLAGRVKVVRPRVATPSVGAAEGMEAEGLVEMARDWLAVHELERAVRHLRAAISLEPHDRQLRGKVAEVEADVRARLADAGIEPSAVPVVEVEPEQLATLDLEPSDGFILSRIDGSSPIEAVVKISPLAEIDALLVIWKLARGGQIRLR